jgi:Fe-S oxidoreductase
VGNFIATTLFSGVSAEKLETAHLILWWIHGIGSLAFIASIPLNFFSHMFKTPWNIFEQKLEPMGAAPKIDNIEEQETFGISQMKQFTWKDRLDFASCTECARCSAVCPAVKMGTPLDPKNVVLKLQHAFANGGENEPTEKFISEDELWACTTCGACTNACPSRINLPDAIVKMRTHYALEEGKFPPGVAKTLQNIASVGNPWGMDPDSRLDWAEGLDLPIMDPDRPVDILYWVGCSASFDKRSQKIARSMVKILKASGLSFGVMAEERCHADFARRLGEEYLFQTAAAENIANLSQYKFGKILCACPHCFNTLENEYPEFEGGKFEVISHVELIRNLIRDGKLPNLSENDIATTYQDPCYLSRYNGLSSEPREILASMKTDMREPQFCKENTNCCGAGGGQFWSDGSKTQRVNVIRFNELKDTGAKQLATACPFCLSMMESAKAKEKDETIQVKDIAEVVAEHLA